MINETLLTLNDALYQQFLVTIIVVLLMVMLMQSAMLISGLLPVAVLMTFIAMKYFGVDANIVALSGIAIAIGTMVDMGIVITENIYKHLQKAEASESRFVVVYRASTEVGSAVVTAVATTIVSFLPVFTMEAAEGKLFKPLAYTKTFALIASVIVAIMIIPPMAQLLFTGKVQKKSFRQILYILLLGCGIAGGLILNFWLGILISGAGLWMLIKPHLAQTQQQKWQRTMNYLAAFIVAILLTLEWLPLGPQRSYMINFIFVASLIGSLLAILHFFQKGYSRVLRIVLNNRGKFLGLCSFITFLGLFIWLGFGTIFGWLPHILRTTAPVSALAHSFLGLG